MIDKKVIGQNLGKGLPLKEDSFKQLRESGNKNSALAPYKKIAQGMEGEFVNYVLSEMKKTVMKDEPDSGEVEFYNSLLNNEYVKSIVEKEHGLGLQDMIMNQIVPDLTVSSSLTSLLATIDLIWMVLFLF